MKILKFAACATLAVTVSAVAIPVTFGNVRGPKIFHI
jgi:hypothetical protein